MASHLSRQCCKLIVGSLQADQPLQLTQRRWQFSNLIETKVKLVQCLCKAICKGTQMSYKSGDRFLSAGAAVRKLLVLALIVQHSWGISMLQSTP